MTITLLFFFVLGLVALVAGAEILVRGSGSLARRMGISPLVIGLTIVAMGTSAPEVAVSVHSSLSGEAGIALGNVVGSNICNVLLILGISGIAAPLVVSRQLVRQDVPVMIGVSVVVLALAADRAISRAEGVLLLGGLAAYLLFLYFGARRPEPEIEGSTAEPAPPSAPVWLDLVRITGGLVILVLGARWLVGAAVDMAEAWGVSKLIIGLTVVAVGTSLPELATSVIATVRGERDIAVGNVVGSNIFNLLGVLGLSGVVSDAGIDVAVSVLRFDLPVMTVVAVACLPIFFTGHRIDRWEGALFLFYFVAYTAYLVLHAAEAPTLHVFNWAMISFVLPLTAITLAVILTRSLRGRAGPSN